MDATWADTVGHAPSVLSTVEGWDIHVVGSYQQHVLLKMYNTRLILFLKMFFLKLRRLIFMRINLSIDLLPRVSHAH